MCRLAALADRVCDHRRPGDGVARGEDAGLGRLQRCRVDLQRPRAARRERRERRRVGAHPDGDDRRVARDPRAVVLVVLRAEAAALVEDGRAALELDRLDAVVAGEAADSPGVVELDALGERLVDLPGVRGHLVARLEADHVHLGGAEPARAAGRVDRDVAAADHDDASCRRGRRGAPSLTSRRNESALETPSSSSPGTRRRAAIGVPVATSTAS